MLSVWALYSLLIFLLLRISSIPLARSHESQFEVVSSPMEMERLHGFRVERELSG